MMNCLCGLYQKGNREPYPLHARGQSIDQLYGVPMIQVGNFCPEGEHDKVSMPKGHPAQAMSWEEIQHQSCLDSRHAEEPEWMNE